MVSSTVSLTSALLQDIVDGKAASLKPEDVARHLKGKLTWRVALFDGEERPVEDVPGLKVTLASTGVVNEEDGLWDCSEVYTMHPEMPRGSRQSWATGPMFRCSIRYRERHQKGKRSEEGAADVLEACALPVSHSLHQVLGICEEMGIGIQK